MRVVLILSFFLTLCSIGCFNVATINLHQSTSTSNALPATEKKGQIELNLYCPGCIGCYVFRIKNAENIKQYSCKGVFIPDTTNISKKLSQLAPEDTSLNSKGYLFTGFCEILSSSLSNELKNSFADVKINYVDDDTVADKILPEFSYISGTSRFSTNTARIVLTATSPEGIILKAESTNSDSISAGHMGWAIPVTILTYPLGSLISITTLQSMTISQMNNLITKSITQASIELVKKIIKNSNVNGASSNWSVKIEIG